MAELAAHPPSSPRVSGVKRRRALITSLEIVSAVLVAVGGVASAWTGYEASLFDGEQSAAYDKAAALRVNSSKAATMAGLEADIDVLTFVNWAGAYASGNTLFEHFMRNRFRPEFKKVFDEWLEGKPLLTPGAPATPFLMPGYNPKLRAEAAALAAAADQLQTEGDRANAHSDYYSRSTVIFAMALFFLAIVQQFKRTKVRASVLMLATGFMIFGIWSVWNLPRAMPG